MTYYKKIIREFRRWPAFEKAYLWSFEKMLEGRQFDRWKTKYDVMEWYIYGVQQRYEELDSQNEKLLEQNSFWAYENELYFGDYYDNLPHEGQRNVDDAERILFSLEER